MIRHRYTITFFLFSLCFALLALFLTLRYETTFVQAETEHLQRGEQIKDLEASLYIIQDQLARNRSEIKSLTGRVESLEKENRVLSIELNNKVNKPKKRR